MLRRVASATGAHNQRWLTPSVAAVTTAGDGGGGGGGVGIGATTSSLHQRRGVSSSSSSKNRPCYGGDTKLHLGLGFKLTAEDAQRALSKWTGQKPLRPWSLRDGDKNQPTLRPAFLPYWIFDISVSVKYRGKVGFNSGGSDGKLEWMDVETWRDGGYSEYPSTHPAVQICASFKHRRDLSAAVTGPHVGRLPGTAGAAASSSSSAGGDGKPTGRGGGDRGGDDAVHLAPMPDARLAAANAARDGAGPPGSVEVERFGIKRSLAWELATRQVREIEREKARKLLIEAHAAVAAKDVVLEVEHHPGRKVRAVRLPAYMARFTHGETMDSDNQIVEQAHAATICGVTGNVVVSDDILCHNKARLISVMACAAPAAAAAAILGPDAFNVLAAQTLCASAVLSTGASIFARQVPRMRREKEECARVADEESAFAAGGGGAAGCASRLYRRL